MKPQSARTRVDGADAATHPSDMASSDKGPKDTAAAREVKLAQALRANLRRRKAGPTLKVADPEPTKGPDQA